MWHPIVSIIIPTYNRTDYLKLTIESILAQTFQEFEIIVVDDGSISNSNEKLCRQFDKIRYIKIENSGGPAKPRNIGIKQAKGKYLAFVDDDDLWLPNKLEKQVAVLEYNSSFGLVHGCCEVIDGEGVTQNRIIGRPGSPDVKHGDVSMRMMGNWTVMMPTSFVRKEIVDEVGFFNEIMPSAGEDTEFFVRCSFETKFFYLDEPLVQYRVHKNNISGNDEDYLELPIHLKKVLDNYYSEGRLLKDNYNQLLNNLCQLQIRTIKIKPFYSINKLFKLHKFWFLGKNNFKMIISVLFFKK